MSNKKHFKNNVSAIFKLIQNHDPDGDCIHFFLISFQVCCMSDFPLFMIAHNVNLLNYD